MARCKLPPKARITASPRYQQRTGINGLKYWWHWCPVCGEMGQGCFRCGWNLTKPQRAINMLIHAAREVDRPGSKFTPIIIQ